MIYGGIEAGGTKWVCGLSAGDGQLIESTVLETTTPDATLAKATRFFIDTRRPRAVGVGAFGPLDLRVGSPTFGRITMTPKAGWANTDLLSPLAAALGVPVAIDTDVNAAAMGEWRWGGGAGLGTFSYLTVGTGIGGGAVVNGRLLHGLSHPEVGHMRVPHDRERDPFEGACPYHGDCLEGLASGEAIRRRWGRPAEELTADAVWGLEAEYVAAALLNVIHILAPERVIVGGGVSRHPALLPRVRARLSELMAGYLPAPQLSAPAGFEDYVIAPLLGGRSGVLGATELARCALEPNSTFPRRRVA